MTSFHPTAIPEVIEVRPTRNGDHRGWFCEAFVRSSYVANGIDADWCQDNQSYSATPGTIRGAHFQVPPHAQAKLIRVLRGAIWDVAIDIRRGSPTYGQSVGLEISGDLGNQLFVPAGFAHAFQTLQPDTEVLYKIDSPWVREAERALRWDDPALGIAWPDLGVPPVLSDKDRAAPVLADFTTPFTFTG